LVQQLDACTYLASSTLDSTGLWYRVGIAETVQGAKRTSTWVASGQFQMPWTYKIKLLNCTP
jgi:hypothetical protein